MWLPALMMNHIVVHKAATETLVVIVNDAIKPIDNHVIIDDMFAEAEGLGINFSLLQTVVTRLVSFCKVRVNTLTSTSTLPCPCDEKQNKSSEEQATDDVWRLSDILRV